MEANRRESFVLTNTATGKRERFIPQSPGRVLFYSCGPTVYGALHIGNARALIFADQLYRWLKHIGYHVEFVRNYTDVDDKIIDRAAKEGLTSVEIAERYIGVCEADIRDLGLAAPSRVVKVTESMPEIIRLIEKILERGHAYVIDGEVLFSIDSFSSYGKLSGRKVEELQAGARVEVDAKKRNPGDFALWKPRKTQSQSEPFWQSPWGEGRPGWHIECSAMVGRWLGDTIDLHHGGQDLLFPHHENETAQSEAATEKPFCRHWVHHGLLTSGNEKMSKSLGNILSIREFIETYGAELLKFIYLSFHYRSAVPYTEAMLTQVLNDLERIYLVKQWAERLASMSTAVAVADGGATENWEKLLERTASVFESIETEMLKDLNTPGAMGQLMLWVRELNRCLNTPGSADQQSRVAVEALALLEQKLGNLWNVFREPADQMLRRIESIRRSRGGSSGLSDEAILAEIASRNAARARKDFAAADAIRRKLEEKGIVLVDSPQGTTWKAKS